jgi:hypothetical protein
MRGLLRTAYVRRITVQYLTVLLYDGNAASKFCHTLGKWQAGISQTMYETRLESKQRDVLHEGSAACRLCSNTVFIVLVGPVTIIVVTYDRKNRCNQLHQMAYRLPAYVIVFFFALTWFTSERRIQASAAPHQLCAPLQSYISTT